MKHFDMSEISPNLSAKKITSKQKSALLEFGVIRFTFLV